MLELTLKQYADITFALIAALGFGTALIGYISRRYDNPYSEPGLLYGIVPALLIICKIMLPGLSIFYLIATIEILFFFIAVIYSAINYGFKIKRYIPLIILLVIVVTIISLMTTPLNIILKQLDMQLIYYVHSAIAVTLVLFAIFVKAYNRMIGTLAFNAVSSLFISLSLNPFGIESYILLHGLFYLSWINLEWRENERMFNAQLAHAKQIEKNFHDTVRRQVKQRLYYMEMAKTRMAEVASTDSMTGALNKKALLSNIDKLILDRRTPVFSILMFDIDNFKTINDTGGHISGDNCLREMAMIAEESIRGDDQLGRYGGDEFVILLPRAEKDIALLVAERFRKKVEKTANPHFTISIGIASYPQDGTTVHDLIAHADAGLYLSKERGKNQTSYKETN